MMLHAKYESSSPYGLGQEYFLSFYFQLLWQPEFFTEFKSLKYSESASSKDHFCEVSSKSVGRFQKRKIFQVIVHRRADGRTYGRMDRRTNPGHWLITIAHSEHIVLRWAKKNQHFWWHNRFESFSMCKLDLVLLLFFNWLYVLPYLRWIDNFQFW